MTPSTRICKDTNGSYKDNIEDAVKEPVRILNEELGIKTISSCAGHHGANDGSTNSYIIVEYKDNVKRLFDHLLNNHFIITSKRALTDGTRAIGKEINFGKRPLLAQLLLTNEGRVIFRMEVFKVDLPIDSAFYSDRRPWNDVRDKGWMEWLDILRVMEV